MKSALKDNSELEKDKRKGAHQWGSNGGGGGGANIKLPRLKSKD